MRFLPNVKDKGHFSAKYGGNRSSSIQISKFTEQLRLDRESLTTRSLCELRRQLTAIRLEQLIGKYQIRGYHPETLVAVDRDRVARRRDYGSHALLEVRLATFAHAVSWRPLKPLGPTSPPGPPAPPTAWPQTMTAFFRVGGARGSVLGLVRARFPIFYFPFLHYYHQP
jgi:hypothetical protein